MIKAYKYFNLSEIENPGYIEVYDFERYDIAKADRWLEENWKFPYYASLVYVICIYVGQRLMKHRKPFNLRGALFAWNVFLASTTMFGTVRGFHELFQAVKHDGFVGSFCEQRHHSMTASYWGLVFMFSKIVEFGDTAFLILRKQNIIFLHWYHHITVCLYCFHAGSTYDGSCRWFGLMNGVVHSFMYTYYALKAVKIAVPKKVAMMITLLQIAQMVLGVAINAISLYMIKSGQSCNRPIGNIYFAFGIYLSYFILFGKFFYRTYIVNPAMKRKQQ